MRRDIGKGTVASLALLVVGCGGSSGGGGGAVEGLSVGTQLQVVTAADEPESASAQAVGDFPADAEYFSDEVRRYVWDPSMEGLAIANEILCLLDQTAYDEMVNEGAYVAQIDEAACEDGERQGGGDGDRGQSASEGAPENQFWTVRSERASNNASQFVSFWVPGDTDEGESEPTETIFAKMEISEAAGDDNPFGVFHMDFAGVENGGSVDDALFRGTLETLDADGGDLGFGFYEVQGDVSQVPELGEEAHLNQVNVQMNADRSRGFARVRQVFRGNFGSGDELHEDEFLIAFDETHFKRTFDGSTVTLSRDEFDSQVWGYNLYHATGDDAGQRVDLVSGFPVESEQGEFGWADYWGVWFNGRQVEDGEVLTRVDGGEDDGQQFTVTKAPGRLIRFQKNELNLDDIVDETFTLFFFSPDQIAPPTDHRVRYTNSDSWELFQARDQNGEFQDITPEFVDFEVHDFLDLWSESLGGHAVYVGGEPVITFWKETDVTSDLGLFEGEDSLSLYGYFDCLKTAMSAETVEQGDIFLPFVEDVQSPYEFEFRAADLGLYHDEGGGAALAGLAAGQVPESGPFVWGMRSGPMVLDAGSLEDVWELWSADEFFIYETGANDWNTSVALIDGDGEAFEFSPPIEFTYTHSTEADRNGDSSFDGRTYLLSYAGDRMLWGIPYAIDESGGDDFERWYPLFAIADGTVMGPDGTEYVIKAVEIEQKLSADPGGAPGLDVSLAEDLVLPDGSNFVTPDIGAEPELDEPPSVIFGEVVGSDAGSIGGTQ